MQATPRISRRQFTLSLAATTAATAFGSAAEPTEEKWRIGCYTRPWDQFDYRTALDEIAEAGFRHAGLMTTKSKSRLVISVETTVEEAEAIATELRQRKLDVPSVYGGGIPVQQSLQAGIDGLRNLIDRCATVKSSTLLMGGIGNKDLYEAYYKAIAECCDYAEERGIGITVKPHGGQNATGPQCRKVIELVGHKNFTLWYDPGNIYYYSEGKLDPVDQAATVDGLVTGMCIKDYLPPKNVMLTPGTGKVDFPKVLARLQKGGFTGGPLVIETLKRPTSGSQEEQLAAVRQEARKARELVEEVSSK